MVDVKVTEMTADATPSGDDLIMTVNDPGGSPASRKATIDSLRFAPVNTFATNLTPVNTMVGEIHTYTGAGTHGVILSNTPTIGFSMVVINKGTGDLTIDRTTNIQTVNNAATDLTLASGAWETVTLIKIATNEWLAKGEI